MSYLSTTENVGFSGIPQSISEASCATQYKMAVEGVSGNCSEVNMFIHDSSGDEQNYITHLTDNYFQSKFKIDPNDLYTFHDSDVIAGEITVSNTDDFIFADNDIKTKLLDSPNKEIDLIGSLTNGEIKEHVQPVVPNGQCTQTATNQNSKPSTTVKDSKTSNTKVTKVKIQSHSKESLKPKPAFEVRRPSLMSPNALGNNSTSSPNKISITSDNVNLSNASTAKSASETFLDVFKREQGLVESPTLDIKTEPVTSLVPAPPSSSVPTLVKTPAPVKAPAKVSASTPKKAPSATKSTQPKPRRGRGPAVHEALQRIASQKRAIPESNRAWHAPGYELFQCGPLDDTRPLPFTFESSSSEDDNMPDFEAGRGPVCVEESAAETRGARLALRRAALRRHMAKARAALKLAKDYSKHRELASLLKRNLQHQGRSHKVPSAVINQLLALQGMRSLMTSQERRRLRESGWSGGESGSTEASTGYLCAEDRCSQPTLPCSRYCWKHVTLDPEQRLYAACAAVFAGGSRCMQPLLPLNEQTPLCTEHAWKRDNYDKIVRDSKVKAKAAAPRRGTWSVLPPAPRPSAAPRPSTAPRASSAPRRPKKRRQRPPPVKRTPHTSFSEINVCSNSSAYDSSEDTAMGALSETEYISAANSHELEVEVGSVPADDILDPAVLSQIPDEAFTEFFNQAEGAPAFDESSELEAALQAVLDERALDSIGDFPHALANNKMQQVPAVSMQSTAPS